MQIMMKQFKMFTGLVPCIPSNLAHITNQLGIGDQMSSVAEHYENLLAPVYTWMAGGPKVAFATGQADLDPVLLAGNLAIDLGAGFGMHSIPLARSGWRVLAIDSSPVLLHQLTTLAQGLQVTARLGDLLDFAKHLAPDERPDLILCMGDTLTHLETPHAVSALSREVAHSLSPGGRFVATFRDYSRLPSGEARFIPVRADEHRVLTCFLEEFDDYVLVHDLLHERTNNTWAFKASCLTSIRFAGERQLKLPPYAGTADLAAPVFLVAAALAR
jgi:2-polyprenyl-3-methyl-5-hydroxy-6-metoxy-1,4-benzoquinol methylase